ncbi:glycerophosphodiester phosphodiesterase family protein [Zoogloeaceae bacterium G21618-S1]|nr:glycerophosphodiester phosphodiesterase family protein [Zoogloeaceae bacterium G21618-S1]
MIAHRCGGMLAPENSIEGLVRAHGIGCRGAEFDAMLAACGTPVLMHDETLERTTVACGRVAQMCWTELANIALKTRDGGVSEGCVPSLVMALETCLTLGMAANIEIKPSAGAEHATGLAVAEVAAHCWTHPGALPPLLSSFSIPALEAAAQGAPALPRALLLERVGADSITLAQALGCVAMVVERSQLSASLITRAHDAGLGVAIYTENDEVRGEHWLASGLDGLITDQPAQFQR